jgi:hypothetical protein
MRAIAREKMKQQFCSTANTLSQLFKEGVQLEKKCYNEGRRKAYTEMLNWVIEHFNNLKRLSVDELIAFIEGKLIEAANTQPVPDIEIVTKVKRLDNNPPQEKTVIEMEGVEGKTVEIYRSKMRRSDFN